MLRRQFLQTGVASSALLALPASAALLHAEAPLPFSLGYHSGRAGDAWMPASARPVSSASRLRIALRGVQAAERNAVLQRLNVDLVYRAPAAPSYYYATLRREKQLSLSQPMTLELDADRLAGLHLDYVWRDADGQNRHGTGTLALTDAFNPLLTPGVYALVGVRSNGTPPSWKELATPGQACSLGRCDAGPIDFDTLIIGVEAA